MKKFFIGIGLLTVTITALSFTSAKGNNESKPCPDRPGCVCCPCTPDCQVGDPNCTCPMNCNN